MGTSQVTHAVASAPLLPPHARLFARRDVWLEGSAVEQLGRAALLPRCIRAAGMPDLHAGPGIPIGAAFAMDGLVYPGLVGTDAGCGVRVAALRRSRVSGDALFRRVQAELEGPGLELSDDDAAEVFDAVWRRGPRGLAGLACVPDSLAALAAAEPEVDADAPPPVTGPLSARALGTIGGGNHFLEVSRVSEATAGSLAPSLGLEAGATVIVAHSGSRGVGYTLAERWGHEALEGDRLLGYLAELAGACRFARANRLVLTWRMAKALKAADPERIAASFDLTHNTVVPEPVDGRAAWVHRKGCAPAHAGQPTIVLGSRGAPSFVLEGTGHAEALSSVAHGAGRKMNRAEAYEKLRQRYTRASLERTKLGSRVLCDDTELLFAEHPDAYKPIEPIVETLLEDGVAKHVATLVPLVTVKL